jgi:MFS family permease
MSRLVTTCVVDRETANRFLGPRDDAIVREVANGEARFDLTTGPFERYVRTVTVEPAGDGQHRLTQVVDFRLAIPFWRPMFTPLYRRALRRPPGEHPWWFWTPPDLLDARASSVLAVLAAISLVSGYLGTLITQTITFAADEFGAGTTGQGTTLAAVRVGVVLALVMTALADRRGRRNLLVIAAAAGCIVTATGALAPGLVWLGVSQTVARGFTSALALLIAIVSAEEVPAGSRAYAFSLLVMSGALGAGVCLWALPLADVAEWGWRLLYVVPLAGLPLVVWVHRRLPESQRFVAVHADAPMAGHGRRFWLLAATGFLLAAFAAPASQLQNEYLKDERGYSAAAIAAFVLITNLPGGVGIVIGGRIADVRGRRVVAAVGIVGGTLLTVVMFLTSGVALWTSAVVGTIAAALVVPGLGVYRPELFPTSLRGRANGIVEVVTVAGSALGLVVTGVLADRWGSIGEPMALLAVLPLLVAVIVLVAYPETARLELEDINPEDRVRPDSASAASG